MAVPDKFKNRYVFHFTDIENLDSIIKDGLLSTNIKNAKGIKHKNVANLTIQERRANMTVPIGPEGKVHDYVPFYFSSMNPMLLSKLHEKNIDQQDIIYFCVKIQRLEIEDAVFTDASANTANAPTFYEDVSDLNKLDWQAIDKKSWGNASDDERHRRMAEALIHKSVDISEIDAILVFNNCIREKVKKVFNNNGAEPPAIILDFDERVKNYHFYYTKFFIETQKNDSLITGPKTLLHYYKNVINEIKEQRLKTKKSYPYRTIKDLLNFLKKDITTIPELKNVAGLLQDYPPHKDTVGNHTRSVVEYMQKHPYYNNALDEKKNILLLSAYLHDIGKGPQSKWKEGKMRSAYPDHPADAVPMIHRILSEEIEILSEEEIRQVCMLVVYHDIIGDCMENGRDKQQIANIIENEDDLDMLFAISCADASAVSEVWGLKIFSRYKSFKEEIMKMS